jgi:molybdopterin molybdotransferase
MIKVKMTGDFGKSAKGERLLRGRMSIEDGVVCMCPSLGQGNAVISSMAGANLMVIIPAGHGPVHAGEIFDGFMI